MDVADAPETVVTCGYCGRWQIGEESSCFTCGTPLEPKVKAPVPHPKDVTVNGEGIPLGWSCERFCGRTEFDVGHFYPNENENIGFGTTFHCGGYLEGPALIWGQPTPYCATVGGKTPGMEGRPRRWESVKKPKAREEEPKEEEEPVVIPARVVEVRPTVRETPSRWSRFVAWLKALL